MTFIMIVLLFAIVVEWRGYRADKEERYERRLDRWARDICKDIDTSQIVVGELDASKIKVGEDGRFTMG